MDTLHNAGSFSNFRHHLSLGKENVNMASLLITGYLSKEVVDNKHRSAREAGGFIRSVIKNANGSLKKIEVLMGTIFITLKDDNGKKELKEALASVEGVKVDEPSQAMLIFVKERARNMAQTLGTKGA